MVKRNLWDWRWHFVLVVGVVVGVVVDEWRCEKDNEGKVGFAKKLESEEVEREEKVEK